MPLREYCAQTGESLQIQPIIIASILCNACPKSNVRVVRFRFNGFPPNSMRSALCFLLALIAFFFFGCTRTRYRTAADRDSYQIIQEKSAYISTQMPRFQVTPDPRSRFHDATNADCPQLPVPRPVLNGYALPDLVTASPDTSTQSQAANTPPQSSDIESASPPVTVMSPAVEQTLPIVSLNHSLNHDPAIVSVSAAVPLAIAGASGNDLVIQTPVTAVAYEQQEPATVQAAERIAAPEPKQPESVGARVETTPKDQLPSPPGRTSNATTGKVAIPSPAWDVLPRNCLERMLEFQSLQTEYSQSFGQSEGIPGAEISSNVRRLTLANLMELATINSREYQTRKEVLFTTALALTRRRYQFELNPSPFGNGAAANFRHLRTNGITENQLAMPSGVGVQRTLATGGEFLARFANTVVLTFNGPSGFASDIGSEMIFDFQQTIFQRDVRFENLTQAERDVIYATRDYLRFRKLLFRDIADQYYTLLLSYRGIEINAQDYFTNLRGFIQSQAEYRTAEKIPRIQVDQFEQNVLRTRSNLVSNCFSLDASLDQLKFRLGLPIEMPLYLELTELQSIALKDELSVARQMISRARAELLNARSSTMMDTTTLANVAEVLAERMSNILRIQEQMELSFAAQGNAAQGNTQADTPASLQAVKKAGEELSQLQKLLKILGVRMQVDLLREELNAQLKSETPAPPLRVLIRAIDYCATQLQTIDLAIESSQSAATTNAKAQAATALLLNRRRDASKKLDELMAFVDKISSSLSSSVAASAMDDLEKIPDRMQESVKLAEEIEHLALDATKDILPSEGKSIEVKVQNTVDKTIELGDRLLEKGPDGWKEIEIDANEALLTGLVQRLDLMNQRGDLADAWRQIKLAGDDLRSIVDLRATQFLRTRRTGTNPFDFTFDESETRLSVALDTPLNRRVQRNNFRVALISYNVGLRNLMAAEDSIKLDVRQDLRQLALDRNQYSIAVASAALAYERVISTRLRLQFGVANVAARDFLEAQQAYTNALSSIARQHVNYITDRTELFFDLEAFDVDQWGHWSGVAEDNAPQVNVDFPNANPRPYDSLPPRVWYSPTIRQMEQIAPGDASVQQP